MTNTKWVKTPEEIETIEERLAHPAFLDGRTLTVTYLTRPELIRAVLPPPLEPAGDPLVSVGVGAFGRSNCVGAFAGGWVDIRARYQGIEADYCLAMPMSTDVAIIFGRELFGEPKKQGRVRLESDGDVTRGWWNVTEFRTSRSRRASPKTSRSTVPRPAIGFISNSCIQPTAAAWSSIRSLCTRTSRPNCES